MEYYSAIKKNEINAICSNMDGPRDYHIEVIQKVNSVIQYHSEVIQKEKGKYHMISFTCGI